MQMRVVIFLGYSNAGKTSAIVSVVGQLVKAGRRVGTLKHIHDRDFTIDTEGKDTWRHSSAGASTVIALAPNELTIIEKGDTTGLTLDELFGIFRSRGVDYLLIEGLYRKLSTRSGVTRVLCAKNLKEAKELLALHPRPVCILNRGESKGAAFQGIPVLTLPRDIRKLIELIGAAGGRR